jgi:hypothetical protein
MPPRGEVPGNTLSWIRMGGSTQGLGYAEALDLSRKQRLARQPRLQNLDGKHGSGSSTLTVFLPRKPGMPERK